MLPQNEAAPAAASIVTDGGKRGWLWALILLNLPFVITGLGVHYLPEFFHPIIVGAIVFVAPGLAWTNLRQRDFVFTLFRIVALSFVFALVINVALMLLEGPVDRLALLGALAVVTNAGVWYGAKRDWFHVSGLGRPLPVALIIIASLFYVQSFLGAAHFVPPLEDQDSETQGTAYGMVNELAPAMVTNRQMRYFFSHPLLLHYWIGESTLLSDDIGRLRYYYESSVAMKGAEGWQMDQQWAKDFAQFQADPVLLPARAPNVVLSFLIIFPLGLLIFRLTGSTIAAAGGAVLYATFPEIYVRTSYGGYLAVTNFFLVCGAYFYLSAAGLLPRRDGMGAELAQGRRFAFGSAFLAGMSDQKGVLMAMTAPVHAGIRFLFDEGFMGGVRKIFSAATFRRPDVFAGLGVGIAYAAGWVAFAAYALIIAAPEFIQDHVKGHIVSRLKFDSIELQTEGFYPSIVSLWQEFANHYGWLYVAIAVVAVAWGVRRIRGPEGYFAVLVLICSIGFSLVDWRQTKHLAHMVPSLVILTACFWASLKGRLRLAIGAALAVAIVWNFTRVIITMQDFEHIKPLPMW